MVKRKKQKRGSPGRPFGTYAKRRFRDTNLGRFILLHEPLLFRVICPDEDLGKAPEIFLIEKVVACSDNPSFQTARYHKYLEDFKKNGLHVQRVRPIPKKIDQHHRDLRFIRALNYIKTHKEEIRARQILVNQMIQMAIDKVEGR